MTIIYCQAGASRSVAIAVAYLMRGVQGLFHGRVGARPEHAVAGPTRTSPSARSWPIAPRSQTGRRG